MTDLHVRCEMDYGMILISGGPFSVDEAERLIELIKDAIPKAREVQKSIAIKRKEKLLEELAEIEKYLGSFA